MGDGSTDDAARPAECRSVMTSSGSVSPRFEGLRLRNAEQLEKLAEDLEPSVTMRGSPETHRAHRP
jgi:hypothetical protein